MESAWTKRKSAAPAKWLIQRFAFCTLGGACPLYLYFNLPLLKGKAIVVPGKATPIHFPAPTAFWEALAHFRIVEEGCTEQSAAGGPYWAFRLASQPSDWFADPSFLMVRNFPHFIIPPPPYKKSRGLGEVCRYSQIHGIFLGYFNGKAHAQKNKPLKNFFLRGFV